MSLRVTSLAVLSAALATACGGGSSDPAPAPVASVTVTLGSSSISVGGGTQASAVLKDAGGNVLGGRAITWSSSSNSVATVSASGGVTAVAAGTASITATSEGQSGAATVTVVAGTASTVVVTVVPAIGTGRTAQATAVAKDPNGNAIPGSTFTWSSSAPGVASISSAGVVTGVTAGTADIIATAGGVPGSATVAVIAIGTVPTRIDAVSAVSQTGPPAFAAAQAPAVVVRDAAGLPVPDVTVGFAVTQGGGSIAGGTATTDVYGKARATVWNFGPAGAQSVRASSAAIPGVTVDFTGLSRVSTQAFDITLRFISSMSDSQARAFVDAKERIQQFIVGDLPLQNVSLSAAQMASCGGVSVQQDVDDVLILAEVGPIDGVNNVLGQAGPCYVRTPGTPWPVVGHMMFDTADLDALEAAGRLEYVILHEMMHVIGFGTIWEDMGLLKNPAASGGTDPTFSGPKANEYLATYNNGAFYAGAKVPVEAGGGAGTSDSHWRETVFNHELMTGYLDSGVNPISATTIGSFQDLGYGVDVTKADAFNLATALRIDWNSAVEPPLYLGNDVKLAPPGRLGPDGRPLAR